MFAAQQSIKINSMYFSHHFFVSPIRRKIKVRKAFLLLREKFLKVFFFPRRNETSTINLLAISARRRLNCEKCKIINETAFAFSGMSTQRLFGDDGIWYTRNKSIERSPMTIYLVFHHCDRQNMCFGLLIYEEKLLGNHSRFPIAIATCIYES